MAQSVAPVVAHNAAVRSTTVPVAVGKAVLVVAVVEAAAVLEVSVE